MEILTINNVQELVTEAGMQKFGDYYKELNKPRFQIKEIGISSKLISDWEKGGLLNDGFQKGKWREFSFIEAVWVNFIGALRNFGVTIENVKEFKEMLFPKTTEDIKKYLLPIIPFNEPGHLKSTQQELIETLNNESDEEIYKAFSELNFSFFGAIITVGLTLKFNMAFLLDEQGGYFINLGKPVNQINAQNIEGLFKEVTQKSFAVINITNLISKFFDNDKLKANPDFYFSIMDEDEREVITAIRSGNYKQITIKMEDGSITQLRLGKKQDEDLMRKISRILKKGDYKEIHLNVKDGSPIKLDVTDIIKIKK